MKPIKRVTTAWTDTVLVCRKCSKKLDGGFGPEGDETLAKMLRAPMRRDDNGRKLKTRRQRIGIVEVGCLGLCPKGAVTVTRGRDPATWWIVPRGTPLATVTAMLDLPATAARPRDD